MEEQVKKILEGAFPGATIDLDEDSTIQKVTGSIVYEGFRELDMLDRQNQVWTALKSGLGDKMKKVSLIFTYTPHELEVMTNGV